MPQATEWQRVGNQIHAAFIFAGSDFVNGRWGRRLQRLIRPNYGQIWAIRIRQSMKNGTLPKFNPPGDKALYLESRVLIDMAQAVVWLIGRMNEELDSVGAKPVFDP